MDGMLLHAFPRPQDLAGLEPARFVRSVSASAKQRPSSMLSRAVVDERFDLEGLEPLGDGEVVSRLMSLHGIGRWSAEYVLLRGLGRLHVFPGDDVGARNNLARWLGLTPPLDYDAVGARLVAAGSHTPGWSTSISSSTAWRQLELRGGDAQR